MIQRIVEYEYMTNEDKLLRLKELLDAQRIKMDKELDIWFEIKDAIKTVKEKIDE